MINTTILDAPGDVAWDIALEVLSQSHGYIEDVEDDDDYVLVFKGDNQMSFTMHEENGSIYGWSYFVEDIHGNLLMEGGFETTNGFENIISFIRNWAES